MNEKILPISWFSVLKTLLGFGGPVYDTTGFKKMENKVISASNLLNIKDNELTQSVSLASGYKKDVKKLTTKLANLTDISESNKNEISNLRKINTDLVNKITAANKVISGNSKKLSNVDTIKLKKQIKELEIKLNNKDKRIEETDILLNKLKKQNKNVKKVKLSCDDIKKIRTDHKNGVSGTTLADTYDVSNTTISRIVKKKTYKYC